ncbi:MAG: phosphatidate cytidylyltransferase [Thermodesulfobacteriota bacterium]
MGRVIPGLILVACWLLLLLQGSTLLFALVIILGQGIGGYEYGRMALSEDSSSRPLFLAFLTVLPALSVCFFPQLGLGGGLVAAFLLLSLWTLRGYGEGVDSYTFLARASLGIVWVGVLGAHLLLLRQLPEGNYWILILTGITAGSDTGAYFAGRAFGRHKLSPLISPNKTIEGAVGGIFAGMAAASLLALLLLGSVPWLFILLSAVVLGLLGICGDLVESVVKRATGTKDSGTILGGHGGILDRADSMLFTAPLLYYLLLLFIVP